jgi:stress-induced morphogen
MPMNAHDIETLIKAKFPDATVDIRDLAGDGDHFSAHVIAAAFKGKTRVAQHKMVYEALEGRMGGVLHALALTTSAPKA